MKTTNPIITGFNPDPSIIRVGDDYYIATSTFEWFPGVQIHHSKDLVNWKLLGRPLDDLKKLDIIGVPDSCGVWAPCLSYNKGIFYLIYSAVKSFDGMYKDTPNYLVTANNINGPWSDPIFMDSSGFDGSLFHDEDGKKYYVSMLVDHRKGIFFGGIIIQEYSDKEQMLVGQKHHIYKGTELGVTEGPHLYKNGEFYYLLTAEGGTEYGHAVSVARSRSLLGPYETHPDNPLISARLDKANDLQKAGHGDFVWTPSGECYLVFLTGRPLSPGGRCTLGRETSIEEIIWKDDGWPHPASGDCCPRLVIPTLPEKSGIQYVDLMSLETPMINSNYQSLGIPITDDWASLKVRKGFLRLYGQEGLSSTFRQSLLARRVQHFHFEYSVVLDFYPTSFQQMAGLVCYYNTGHYIYLNICGDEEKGGRYLNLIQNNNFEYSEALDLPILLPSRGLIVLKSDWNKAKITFYYKTEKSEWTQIGKAIDGSILSDDYVREGSDRYRPAFTGAFVGIACQDLTGGKHFCDFKSCEYKEMYNE